MKCAEDIQEELFKIDTQKECESSPTYSDESHEHDDHDHNIELKMAQTNNRETWRALFKCLDVKHLDKPISEKELRNPYSPIVGFLL